MKGRIDSEGNLHRDGKKQYCPFAPLRGGAFTQCGDWCPHFEVTVGKKHKEPVTGADLQYVSISLCQKTTLFFGVTGFTDERGTDESV